MTLHRAHSISLSILIALGSASFATAQESKPAPTPPPQPTPTTQPAPSATPPAKPATQPTLDDLLGLKPDAKKDTPASKDKKDQKDQSAADLDRKLSPQETKERFEEAITLMGDTAERLQKSRDAGLETQRLQEDIVRRLDMVIREAEKNRQQNKSKSKQKQKQNQQQNQSQQQQQQNQSQRRQDDRHNSDSRDNLDPPAGRPAELNPELTARGQAWGALPQRVRDALLQGTNDKYSTLYQRMTEQYYRKLAEEGKK